MTLATAGVYQLPQEHRDFRDVIRQIASERVAPRAAEIDETDEYPWDLRHLLAEHDVLALPFDEKHGGAGTGALMLGVAVELFGSEELKQRILPRCDSGEWSPAFCLSEAEAGSDPSAMRTTAGRDGDDWIISGSKAWISTAGVADFYVVFAVTDTEAGRSTAFLVEKDRSGRSIASYERKLGIHGSPTGTPVFDSVRIPDENRIGEVGRGLRVALSGRGSGAADYATAYADERIAFGHPISELQAIQFKLADLYTRTAAARELLYKACSLADRGDADAAMYSSMAKLFASDTAMDVTVDAVQVLGGYGYVRDYPVERMMRDAKITQIYKGTNEIQRLVIARQLRR